MDNEEKPSAEISPIDGKPTFTTGRAWKLISRVQESTGYLLLTYQMEITGSLSLFRVERVRNHAVIMMAVTSGPG